MVLTNILAFAWTGIGFMGMLIQIWLLRHAQEDHQYAQRHHGPTVLISRMHVRTAVGRLYVVAGNVVFGVAVIIRSLLVTGGHATAGDQWGMALGGLLSIHLVVSEGILVWLGYADISMRRDLEDE